jgi:hypothetical protein
MKIVRAQNTALAKPETQIEPWRDPDWQKLWLSLRSKPWSSMAIVPAAAGGPLNFTLTIAVTLARIGTTHLGTPVHVADATTVSLMQLEQLSEEIRRMKQEGELVLVALAPAVSNPITVTLAQAADSALLCVLFEQMALGESKRTVDRIGVARFAGSVVFRAPPPAPL